MTTQLESFKITTEANEELNVPAIGWEQGEFIHKEDSDMAYNMIGYSEDGRLWEGSALYCLGDIVQWPLEDGYIRQVCSKCEKNEPFGNFSMCQKCLDSGSGHSGNGNF